MNNILTLLPAEYLGFGLSLALYLVLMISVLRARTGSGHSPKHYGNSLQDLNRKTRHHYSWNG